VKRLTTVSPTSLRQESQQESLRIWGISQKNFSTALPWQRVCENVLSVCRSKPRNPLAQAAAARWTQDALPRRVP